MSALEGGTATAVGIPGALAVSSGQAAETLAILTLCESGDHIVASAALYGGTYNLLHYTLPKMGITVSFVDDPDDLDAWSAAVQDNTKAFFGEGGSSRLRPSYFPFTEPSSEFDIQRPDGSWIELGGCGMVHPNVLTAGGLDPEEWSGFAFGFGIDRMAIMRHGVGDIREMFTDDLRFIEQF